VNNAGIVHGADFLDLKDPISIALRVNLKALSSRQLAARKMLEQVKAGKSRALSPISSINSTVAIMNQAPFRFKGGLTAHARDGAGLASMAFASTPSVRRS
jgi:hypothetical protein